MRPVIAALVVGSTLWVPTVRARAVWGTEGTPAAGAGVHEPATSVSAVPADTPYKPTPRERREAERLVGRYRRAKNDLDKKAQVIQEAMAGGPYVLSAVFQVLGQELYPQLEKYRARFAEQAARIGKRQLGSADLEEIARLRAAVLELSKRPELTKQMILQVADPAVARLAEIFLVNRFEVLAASPQLQAERQRLLAMGGLWELCVAYFQRTAPAEAEATSKPVQFEQYLQGEEELAVGLAVPMDATTREVLAANGRLAAQLDPQEARAILALNLTRNLLGLPPLAIDPRLCAAARDHSRDMERLKFFSHESPVEGKKTPWDRAKRFGTSASAENIFAGTPDGHAAHLGWFHSPGHHKNMMGSHKRVGVGRSGSYFTQIFGG